MLILIHGDDIVSSRKYFLDQKNKYPDALLLEGGSVTLTDLAQIFEGGGLFDDSKTVFLEYLISKKSRGHRANAKKPTEFGSLITYLETQSATNTIFLWENKELEKSSSSLFKKAEIKPFKLPQTLFLFLDSIKPGNDKQLIALFHKTLEASDAEMIFFMLIRQVRLLLGLLEQTDEPIDELKRMAPWQKDKLKRQASLFKKEHLIKIYSNLFQLEVGQKTGGLSSPLTSAIDFLLLEI